MEKKIIIIWRFREAYVKNTNSGELDEVCFERNINDSGKKKLIGITAGHRDYTSKEIIKKINSEKDNNKILLLLHKNENIKEDNIKVIDIIRDEYINKNCLLLDTFSGSSRMKILYEELIDADNGVFNNKALTNSENWQTSNIKFTVFDKIWNHYNKLDDINIFWEKKFEFIKLWLPIAIDMQGLYEVKEKQKDDTKFKEYLGKISNSYKEHFNKINSFHKENKEFFDIEEVKKNILSDKVNFILKYYEGFPEIFEVALKKFDEKIKEEHK